MNTTAFQSLSTEQLTSVVGGAGAKPQSSTMPRSEVTQWLQACAKSAYTSGLGAGFNGEMPATTKEFDSKAIAACNAGIDSLKKK
jgi:hypothetical protein